ncbi:CD3337/EF1877 family mobilome membrane protein [Liquorilactobacillus mali]|uniref:Uncharacterized protein n=1 Tax=Liquorilactobacillus mali KCTC 3596 = DSM 20444 TaxID=1046596 RepID=J0L6Q3_9LACO|nr:hypothetical protein [Liquorilactobacillus mali]EJF00683.1 hypothetical protein LMA_03024 [Liquorilactobacillus mali KCTC 3596 = DSM 20444]KRN08935.1 hypothetical protein FD00_GL001643 [Liquorilactobacillus mali KCTC 3596 = DSM 20444]MDC7954080.1 hypothetical protein [Liquorilactobacillus mali]QFQ75730.1 hypothetical protein LM596_11855 [Liquorilactobacillus mali]
MKIKKLVPMILIMLGFLFIGNVTVHADNGLDSVKKAAVELAKQAAKKYNKEHYYTAQDVKQGGVTLNSERYPIDQYKGYANLNTTTHPVKEMIRVVGNTFFYINKLIWQGFDKIINLLSTTDVLNGKIDQINSAALNIWNILIDNFLALILVVVAIVAGYAFVSKNDLVGGFSIIGKTVLVFVLCSVFLALGTTLMKSVNTISGGIQGSFLKVGLAFDGSAQSIDTNQPEAGTTAVLRNTYFDAAVYRPYLLMNYGTTNEKSITKNNSDRIDNLLKQKKDSGSDKVVKDEDKKLSNKYMQDGDEGINTKLAIGLVASMITLGLGIPLLLISLFNLIIQIGILALLLLVPLSFFVSLLPWFGNSGYKNLGRIIGLFFFKAFTAMFIMFLLLIIQIVDGFISPNSVGGYIANSALLIIVVMYMLMKRDWIVSTVTGGRVAIAGGGNNTIRQMAGAASRNIERRTSHRQEPQPRRESKDNKNSRTEKSGRQEEQQPYSKKATSNAREESGRQTEPQQKENKTKTDPRTESEQKTKEKQSENPREQKGGNTQTQNETQNNARENSEKRAEHGTQAENKTTNAREESGRQTDTTRNTSDTRRETEHQTAREPRSSTESNAREESGRKTSKDSERPLGAD